MVFGYDVPVKFSVEGACKTASVHLTGYFQPGPDDEEEEDEDEDGIKLIYSIAPVIQNQWHTILNDMTFTSDEGMDEEMYKKLLAEGGKGGDSDDEDGKNQHDWW
jgi:hypothetical protein